MASRPALTTVLSVLLLAGLSVPAARADSALPAGAVVAFTPETVCETLPGGWQTYAAADGRVIVGAMPGVPASGPRAALPAPPPQPLPPPGSPPPPAPAPAPPINPPDYWAQNLTLTPSMAPRQALTGAGQIVVTAPTVTLQASALAGPKTGAQTTYRLYGYPLSPPKDPGSEALAVGYGPAGVVGKAVPDPIQVAPPFIALKMCVKR